MRGHALANGQTVQAIVHECCDGIQNWSERRISNLPGFFSRPGFRIGRVPEPSFCTGGQSDAASRDERRAGSESNPTGITQVQLFLLQRMMDSETKSQGMAADVVVTKKAFNLACSWVQKMSGGADFDVEEESKGLRENDGVDVRPLRLGLGAKYLSHSQANRVSTQVDRKLRAKLIPTPGTGSGFLQGGRRESKGSRREEEEVVDAEHEEEQEEDDSRASNFKKRSSAFVRPTLIVSETTGSKKKKKKNGGT